jgi:arylsulfatase A-like enzyme
MKLNKNHHLLLVFFTLLIVIGLIFKIGYSINKNFKKNVQISEKCSNCNIFIIDIDLLRADALPCYGYDRNTAPNICSFAKKSVIFNDNYATATWTLPSIFSTTTSLYESFHGVHNEYVDKLSQEIPTLAETLQKKGYQTAFVANWIDYAAILTQNNGGLRGYDLVTDKPIEQVLSDLSKDSKPWFIHYYLQDLHMPYLIPEDTKPIDSKMIPPKKLLITPSDYNIALNSYLKEHYLEVFQKEAIDKYKSIIFSKESPNDTSLTQLFYELYDSNKNQPDKYLIDAWKPRQNVYMDSFDQKKQSDLDYVRMLYDTNIKILDDRLKTLLDQLASESLSKQTITVIMSDHGESFGEHGKFNHESDYHSELFYTPLIIRSSFLPQKRLEQTSSNIDIFPTLLDLIDIEKPSGLQGYSLVPNINNSNFISKPYVLSEDRNGGIILQNKNWLYFLPGDATDEKQSILHEKKTDPNEEKNVADKYPELTSSLYKQASIFRSYNKISDDVEKIPDPDAIQLDPKKIKRLQKEGYF